MTFAAPQYLWLLLAIPPAMIGFFWWSWRARHRLMTQFIQARLLPGLIAGLSARRQRFRAACLVLAAVFLILALARPQWGYALQEIRQRGLDIVVAIDTSKSMLAEDIAPNRLARARLAALDLMQQAKFDRLGLVAFAGSAFLQCPLTLDNSAFEESVDALDVNTIPQGGTAIAGAIRTAQQAFSKSDNYKVLVLFTDGEDHDSGALEAARQAAKAGMRIFTIGIGSTEGDLLRITDAKGQSDYIRDRNGNVVKSRLNEQLLRQIAGATKGFYLPLRGADTMEVLYQKGLAPLPKSESQERWLRRPLERYHWPLALAMILLTAEMFFPERKRHPAGVRSAAPPKPRVAQAALLMFLLLVPATTHASPSTALRDYRSGEFNKAYREYERLLRKDATDPRLHFNAGAAAYREERFPDAERHFNEALTSQDLKLQEQAYYNLGNTLYHIGETTRDPSAKSKSWEQALKQYESSMKLDPQDADAKYNYDYVKKKLEQLKKQQRQQQKSQSNPSQKNQKQQQQKQQNQPSKDNRQQKSQSQQQQQQNRNSNQSQEAQKRQEQKRQQEASQSKEKKQQEQAKQQQARQSSGEKKNAAKPGEQKQPNQAYAAGEMTPREARQLLNSQKGDEKLLPVQRPRPTSREARPAQDW